MSVDTNQAIAQAQTSLRNKASKPTKEGGQLEKQDFMNLFLTQMSNQDPVDPMDSSAMMNQLAQMGTLEQLENLNSQVKELNTTQKDISRYQSLNFLDKDVMIEAKDVELAQGSGKPVYYNLKNEADKLKVEIEDADGMPVFSEQLGITASGKHQFIWNGKNNEGVMMPDGKYTIRFTAFDKAGNTSDLKLFNAGRVGQVEYQDGVPWIKMNNQTMPLSKVQKINTLSSRTFGNAEPLPYLSTLPTKKMQPDGEIDNQKNKINIVQ